MFRRLPDPGLKQVEVLVEGARISVPEGTSVAAAVLCANLGHCRSTPVSESLRAPYCMMGVCFDCLMEIDGIPNQQSCQVPVREGMRIQRQLGARSVKP